MYNDIFCLVTINFHSCQLQEQYQQTLEEKEYQKDIVEKLKDDEYAAKYARAKYSFSKDGEYIYTIPNLLPK